MQVYGYPTVEEARQISGRSPVGLKWMGLEKYSGYRRRPDCTGVQQRRQDDVLSATPPAEAARAT